MDVNMKPDCLLNFLLVEPAFPGTIAASRQNAVKCYKKVKVWNLIFFFEVSKVSYVHFKEHESGH